MCGQSMKLLQVAMLCFLWLLPLTNHADAANVLVVRTEISGSPPESDAELTTFLQNHGHSVIRHDLTTVPSPSVLSGIDLILVSRNAYSIFYIDEGEPASWNSLNKPL